jgi:imidazolonepropionase-like amidohydrolase
LSPADALRAATSEALRFLGREESSGTIDIGKMADLVILDPNPLENIRHTRRISTVVRAGVVIEENELKRLHLAAVRER